MATGWLAANGCVAVLLTAGVLSAGLLAAEPPF